MLVCLCLKHTNVALKLKALDETLEDGVDVDPDHFAESQQKMDVKQLLQKIKDPVKMSEWKRVHLATKRYHM